MRGADARSDSLRFRISVPRMRPAIMRGFAALALWLMAALAVPAAAHGAMKFRNAAVEPLTFAALDGWKDDDQAVAFQAFLKSCSAILQGSKAMRRARPVYDGLYQVCARASAAGPLDREQARAFFEQNFKPVRILPAVHTYGFYTGADGFFTGYYEGEVTGSRVKTKDFNVPLYKVPAKLAGKKSKVFAQYDRKEIEDGALAGKGLEICWIKNPVDAFFAQIQGSTRVKLDDGKLLRLNYIASNGKRYTPVGRILIDQGVSTPEEMSMDKIRDWMEANPKEGEALRRKNRSFVFFTETPLAAHDECIGAQGIPLTPWRSLAVDPSIHVYGTPIWIDAKFPLKSDVPQDTFRHLMVAQDTGSAIRGAARADIYFGHGEDTPHIAGRIKQFGKFVMLMPQSVPVAGSKPPPVAIPLPQPRPTEIAVREAMAASKKPAPSVAVKLPVPKPRP
jgi:membrane-bound lytic murein transglycosylase A